MNFFETFYKSYKMSLTCLDHRMLNTRTRQFLVNLLEVKLWMVRHWCMEYLYSNKIYVYKKMKMIWLQLQWNSNYCNEYKQLFELTSNMWNIGVEEFWFIHCFCINYLKIALMTFFVEYHYSAISKKTTKFLIIFCITTLRSHF